MHQPPPYGYPPQPPQPPGYGPPPQAPPPGYYPPPSWVQPPPQASHGWEGSKTLVSLILGCLGLVLLGTVGPWIGCAACACAGSVLEQTSPRGRR